MAMKLLCALMVGSTCISWFPKGTKKADIATYGQFVVSCDLSVYSNPGCEKPLKRYVRVVSDDSLMCRRVTADAAMRKPLSKVAGFPDGYYACTKREVAAFAEEFRRANLSPLERQNEDAGK